MTKAIWPVRLMVMKKVLRLVMRKVLKIVWDMDTRYKTPPISKLPNFQVTKFLKEDRIDKKNYKEGIYVCSHFARDVCNNAEAEGLRCAYVGLVFQEGGHAIIAFNTIDEGLVYFEPQSDEIVTPVIGKQYYKCMMTL